MKIAIMQPYLFPYIGYFQLLNAVDKFVVFDDVNFINKGWINRNKIIVNGREYMFTIPTECKSQNKLINQLKLGANYFVWRDSFLKTLSKNYKKNKLTISSLKFIEEILNYNTTMLLDLLYFSIDMIAKYLVVNTEMTLSSMIKKESSLKGQDKIIDICLSLGATEYINPIGGIDLYSRKKFIEKDIKLSFLQPGKRENNFSIIDLIMRIDKKEIIDELSNYQLI